VDYFSFEGLISGQTLFGYSVIVLPSGFSMGPPHLAAAPTQVTEGREANYAFIYCKHHAKRR